MADVIVSHILEESPIALRNIQLITTSCSLKYLVRDCIDFINASSSCRDRAVLNKKLEAAQAICDVAWENVNTGHWKDVPLGWRQLYSYGSIFKTIFQSFLGEPLLDILHTCDMGLLMGAPVMENMLSKIASKLHSLLPMQISPEALEKLEKQCYKTPSMKINFPITHLPCPSLETFASRHFNKEEPVVITKGMDYWPALSSRQWSISHLLTVAGGRTVPVEIGSKYTDEAWSQKLMTIATFVSTYLLKEETYSL